MSPRDLLEFSFTALARHRRRTALSLLGVSVGVASVVLLTALGEGARVYVTGQFESLGSNLLIIIPGRNETTGVFPAMGGVPNDLTLEDARALARGVREVRRLAPLSMGNETLSHLERQRQVMVLGSTRDFMRIRGMQMAAGSFLPEGEIDRGAPVAVLGATLARELFPDRQPLGQPVRIGSWRMRVIGVLSPQGTQLGMNLDEIVLVPVAYGMRIFNLSSLFRILLEVGAHAELDTARARVLEILTERHGEEDVTCLVQESVVSSLSKILSTLTLALGGIASVSLAVAGLGIMNLMLVSVSERTREVGLLKAIGAGHGQVLSLFLAEATLLATAGALLGVALGWALVRLVVAFYPDFPASPPTWAVGAAVAVAIGTGTLFGVIPARRATQLDPVRALAGR